jgi:large subunit ribosomal protein L17
MRHGNKVNKLSRKKAHRVALLSNLAIALVTHKRIVTTLAKAKALRSYIEPLLTKTKKGDTKETISHNHRIVFSHFQDKTAVKELFTVIAPKIATRPGGYTRIIKLGIRPGDNAEKAMIELVDFNDVYGKHIVAETTEEVVTEPVKKTRRAGAKKKADATETATDDVVATEE